MNETSLGLTGFGFWLAIALIVIAIIWAVVKKQQMKHDLTLKLLEKGQSLDHELLAKLLAADNPRLALQQKSVAEQHREAGGFIGFLFLVAGLLFACVGIIGTGSELLPGTVGPAGVPLMELVDKGPNWLLIGLGAFTFVFGWLCWAGSMKQYQKDKAEEKLSRD